MRKIKQIPKGKKTSIKFFCEICTEKEYLQTHHIEGRNIPNANHPSNLCNICVNCHAKVHKGMIIIEGWFMTTSGRELFWHKKGDEGFTGEITSPYIIPK